MAAYVVPSAGATIDPAAVKQWVAAHMADYAVPRFVRVVDTIARNRTGKVDKTAIRQALLAELETQEGRE